MFPIRVCMVLLILVTWNDWTTVLICWCFSESNGCCCGNKTTTKKHLKLTVYPNIRKEILANQIKKPYQTISEAASLPKNSVQWKSLRKTISREISTNKDQVVLEMKNCKPRNWWNLIKRGCFIRFHQFWFLPFFLLRCFLRFFGEDVSSFFLVDIFFFRCFFRRDFSSIPSRFFGGDFWSDTFWQGMSLQSFLGIIFRDNFW